MKHIAYLTMDCLKGFFAYDHLTIEPLRQRDCRVQNVSWRRPDVLWDQFDLVVIRSPWDYQKAPQQFLSVLEAIEASGAQLQNSLNIVRWNICKEYLRDLDSGGVPIIPTQWLSCLTSARIEQLIEESSDGQFVCKPLIGAGADRTWWLSSSSDDSQKLAALNTYHAAPLMIQPFIRSVIDTGEYSLFYFGGKYSHSILKTPAPGDFRVQEEHGGRLLTILPDPDLVEVADRAVKAIPEPVLYARVDLVRLSDSTPAVMELELIEPSLYFAHDTHSPTRFADAVVDCLTNGSR
ncbi:MAG: hypothetical protein R3C59_00345 [Planctomycetaceae bacterium]